MPSKFQYRLSTLFFLTVIAAVVFACFQPETEHQKIKRLIAKIDDYEADNWNGAWATPSGRKLMKIGLPAADQTLAVMLEEDEFRRDKARQVFMTIIHQLYSKDDVGKKEWDELLNRMDRLDPKAPLTERQEGVRQWKVWFADKANLPPTANK
jgi:hypothetical protein